MDQLLTAKEVAEALRVSVNAVSVWYRQGLFPNAFQAGRNIRIPASDVEAFKQRPCNKEAS